MRNPNKRISIYYRGGSYLSAWNQNHDLCSDSFPVFYQGHQNTSAVSVLLSWQAELGSQMITKLEQQQETGTVPLLFRGKVPMRVKLQALVRGHNVRKHANLTPRCMPALVRAQAQVRDQCIWLFHESSAAYFSCDASLGTLNTSRSLRRGPPRLSTTWHPITRTPPQAQSVGA